MFPLLDMLMAVIRRVRQKRSPFSPDKKHLHHKMLNLGHTVVESVVLFYGWVTLFSFTVLALLFFDSTYVFVCSGTIFVVMAFFMFRRRMFVILTSDSHMKEAIRTNNGKTGDVITISRKDPLDSVVEIISEDNKDKK